MGLLILIIFSVHSFILFTSSLLTMRAAFVAGALAAGTNAFPFFNQQRDVVTKYETATALAKAQDTCQAGTVTVTNDEVNTVTVTREETKTFTVQVPASPSTYVGKGVPTAGGEANPVYTKTVWNSNDGGNAGGNADGQGNGAGYGGGYGGGWPSPSAWVDPASTTTITQWYTPDASGHYTKPYHWVPNHPGPSARPSEHTQGPWQGPNGQQHPGTTVTGWYCEGENGQYTKPWHPVTPGEVYTTYITKTLTLDAPKTTTLTTTKVQGATTTTDYITTTAAPSTTTLTTTKTLGGSVSTGYVTTTVGAGVTKTLTTTQTVGGSTSTGYTTTTVPGGVTTLTTTQTVGGSTTTDVITTTVQPSATTLTTTQTVGGSTTTDVITTTVPAGPITTIIT